MKNLVAFIATMTVTIPLVCVAAQTQREATQEALDAKCEAARQSVLAPQREKHVAECVEKKEKEDLEACERFYRDYGERSGHTPALYYQLQECVDANDYRESYRQ